MWRFAVITCNKRVWSPITEKIFMRRASNHQDEEINSLWDMHKQSTPGSPPASWIWKQRNNKTAHLPGKGLLKICSNRVFLKIRVAQVVHSRWKMDVRSTPFNALKLPTCNTLTKCVCWFLKEKLLTAICFLVLLNVFCYLKRNSLQPFSAFSGADASLSGQ